MKRRNVWEHILESTEGPMVTVTIPRAFAEDLLRNLATSLEQDMPGLDDDGDEDEDDDLDSVADLDFDSDDMSGPPEEGDEDMDFMPAGDDEDDEMPFPPKKGPGRPPGSKKKGGDEDDKEEEDDEKDESAGPPRPGTALGESAFSRLNKKLSTGRKKR